MKIIPQNEAILDIEDEGWKARIRFDGCVTINEEDQDFMTCHIDGLINLLESLREEAKKYFGEDWK